MTPSGQIPSSGLFPAYGHRCLGNFSSLTFGIRFLVAFLSLSRFRLTRRVIQPSRFSPSKPWRSWPRSFLFSFPCDLEGGGEFFLFMHVISVFPGYSFWSLFYRPPHVKRLLWVWRRSAHRPVGFPFACLHFYGFVVEFRQARTSPKTLFPRSSLF